MINSLAMRDLALLEKMYGLDFSEGSLLIRVALGNLFLNQPSSSQMNQIATSIKDNKTFHAFLEKILTGENNID